MGRSLIQWSIVFTPAVQCPKIRHGGFDSGLFTLMSYRLDGEVRNLIPKGELHEYIWKLLQERLFALGGQRIVLGGRPQRII